MNRPGFSESIAGIMCDCGHTGQFHRRSDDLFYICVETCDCIDFRPSFPPPKPTPRPKPATPTFSPPDHIARDVRKFALSQAVKYASIGGYTGNAPILDFAAKFEDYVMNGKKADR